MKKTETDPAMSENSEEKPFKTLKLTTLKAAKPAAPKESGAPGAAQASASPEPAAPALLSESASASTTPAPRLSPPAAATGSVLKPFKVLPVTSVPSDAATPAAAPESKAFKPLEMKVAKAAASGTVAEVMGRGAASAPPPLPAEEKPAVTSLEPTAAEVKPTSLVKLKGPEKAAPAAPEAAPVPKAKAAVAKPSLRPLLVIGGVVLALLIAIVTAMVVLSEDGSSRRATRPVVPAAGAAKNPSAGVEKPAENPESPAEKTAELGEGASAAVVGIPVPAPAPEVIAEPIRTRRPELESWLNGSRVTAVSAQRLTMNDQVYSLNDKVGSEGALRWVGRDSRTSDLLFIDEVGAVYSKPTRGIGR